MQKSKMHPVNMGKQIRMSYARTDEGVLEIPNLVELQRSSYEWFLKEGLKEVFEDISPITDFNGNLILEFVDFYLDSKPKYSIEECRERDATYSAPLKVKARLHNKETGTCVDSEVFMGDFPLMTENATFIINGAERVIVSQLVRSPGIYYDITFDKTGKKLFASSVIPNRGAWLEYETDSNDIFYVRVDRTRKVPITVLLRSLGLGTDAEILEKFGEEPKILETIQKDTSKTYEEGLLEMYKRIRPGEPPTVDSAETLLRNMFFDPKRYDLAKVGRYKFNKKLALRNRVTGLVLADNVVDPMTGEVIASEGDKITVDLANAIQNTGIEAIYVYPANSQDRAIKILSNRTVELTSFVECNPAELGIKDNVYYPVLEEILEEYHELEDIKKEIKARKNDLIPKSITLSLHLLTITCT